MGSRLASETAPSRRNPTAKGHSGYRLARVPGGPIGPGYDYEHRVVMAQHLGRPLLPGEVVHHGPGGPGDNRIENLELFTTHSEHRVEELARRYGPKPVCPSCGGEARRGRTYCSRACYDRRAR